MILPLVTRHAAARMQQRAIPAAALEFLLNYGSWSYCKGAESVFFDHTARKRAADELGREALRRFEKYMDAYVIISPEGAVLTAAWRQQRMKRH